MHFQKMITAVDSHTAGEPTRVVTGGMPFIPGNTMLEKRDWMARFHDELRTALMWEPRGHADMFGAIITPPVSGDADAGVLFMDGGGYLTMCGHGSIGAVTVLLETGMIAKTGQTPATVVLDTPAGKIRANAEMDNGQVLSVSIQNVASFLYSTTAVEVPGVGGVSVDVAFGGNFFALVDASALPVRLHRNHIPELTEMGLRIRDAVNRKVDILHPETGLPGSVALVEFYDETVSPPVNVVIFGNGQVDRSPCGTGTSAKMAALHAHGKLAVGDVYTYQSITGTRFKGRILAETQAGALAGVIPEITGSAFITGIQQFVLDARDPFRHGFNLSGNGNGGAH